MSARGGRDPLWIALVAAYLAYAAVFIFQTSFLVGGERYFSLFDDAMISMRYARNLAEGHGLVWNPGGERVEGITNPLWTLYLALAHRLGLPESKVSLVVQATGALLLAANLFVVRALALRLSGRRAVALAAAALTAFYLPLNNWALQGMEVGLLALLLSTAALLALRAWERGRFSPAPYLVLGIATLVRPDGVVPLLALAGFLALADRPRRLRHAAAGALTLLLFVGAQTALRLWYYGDVLPNTYYLKMTGYPALLRMTRGAWVLLDFAWYANPLIFFLPLGLLLFRHPRGVRLLLALFAAQVVYSVYVGGDAWEWWGGANRYIVVAMPLYFVLLAMALRGVGSFVLRHADEAGRLPWKTASAGTAWVALVALAAVSFNALKGPRSLPEWLLLDPPMHVEDNAQMTRLGVWLRENAAPDAVVAVQWAGATPYFAHRTCIDLLGKSDRRIARLPMVGPPAGFHRFLGFWPGHLKWDYAWSIQRLRPDVVFNREYDANILPHLAGYRPVWVEGATLYVRVDSRALRPPP
ncbi:MAG TPA: hypothetical protein VFX98_03660 [Longimicrobiaceae bacterium]|nr:hypothetical protein [Longimicrobiaceae bacterium]